MKNIKKEDLERLRDSKPIGITAHTHETIVPVVYARMVNEFLERKGVKLPLTHHQLADLKRKAETVHKESFAKGTKNLKIKNKVSSKNIQQVIVNLHKETKKRGRKQTVSKWSEPIEKQVETYKSNLLSKPPDLIPSNYSQIRP